MIEEGRLNIFGRDGEAEVGRERGVEVESGLSAVAVGESVVAAVIEGAAVERGEGAGVENEGEVEAVEGEGVNLLVPHRDRRRYQASNIIIVCVCNPNYF